MNQPLFWLAFYSCAVTGVLAYVTFLLYVARQEARAIHKRWEAIRDFIPAKIRNDLADKSLSEIADIVHRDLGLGPR